jgi:cell division protease FtsH
VNEAALFAARGNKRLVDMEDFERAKDKIMMGAERRSMVMPEEERRNTAYHESGHAVVASCCRRPTRCTRSPSSRAAARWA